MPSRSLVFEIVIPEVDADVLAEELERAVGELGERPPLDALLGFDTNEVLLTYTSCDGECEECGEVHTSLASMSGFIVRSRVSDDDWVALTSDRHQNGEDS